MKKLLVCLLIFFPFLIGAQGVALEEALGKFSKYPQEKIYIQFDLPEPRGIIVSNN